MDTYFLLIGYTASPPPLPWIRDNVGFVHTWQLASLEVLWFLYLSEAKKRRLLMINHKSHTISGYEFWYQN
jgi:hypothetical protein